MTDQPANTGEILEESSKPGTFKKGYDPRRWLKGQPKKPKDKKKAEELLEHIIWDVLSEEIRNPSNGESIDRLRAMIRSMTTSRQSADKQAILDRIAGKVKQDLEINNTGITKVIFEYSENPTPTPAPSTGTGQETTEEA